MQELKILYKKIIITVALHWTLSATPGNLGDYATLYPYQIAHEQEIIIKKIVEQSLNKKTITHAKDYYDAIREILESLGIDKRLLIAEKEPILDMGTQEPNEIETGLEFNMYISKKEKFFETAPAGISFLIADLKLTPDEKVKILEFGNGTASRFDGYDYLYSKAIIWKRLWDYLSTSHSGTSTRHSIWKIR